MNAVMQSRADQLLQENPARFCRLFDDLPQQLRRLQSGGITVSHTTGYPASIMAAIAAYWRQTHGYVPQMTVASDQVVRGRPNPEAILAVISALGAKKHECVVMDDSEAGIQAGLNAGVDSVGIWKYGYRRGPILLDDGISEAEKRHRLEGADIETRNSLGKHTHYVYPSVSEWVKLVMERSGTGTGY